ncbi:serine hydrolase [Variovorax sp. W2I14]|uniref:serine hydrolase n=1 Tax=Variovorax sp. W2I14 TaxID=3042290 RepID=UPI003D214F71
MNIHPDKTPVTDIPSLASRRQALRSAAAAIAAPALVACGGGSSSFSSFAQTAPTAVSQAINDFAAMGPDTSGALVRADVPIAPWSTGQGTERKLFAASAVKTFILAQFLRGAEAAGSSIGLSTRCEVSDAQRSISSSVLGGLTGTSNYGNVLDAMIARSDNTATDIAMAAAGPDRVRALIAQAGLTNTQIFDSTRRVFSYLAGAPIGVDLGWPGMLKILSGDGAGLTPRTDVINSTESMLSSASDLVSWYQQALTGKFFSTAASLREFKRISSQATALWQVVPADVISYGKGGSIDWEDFHALSLAGQMRFNNVPVTFAFVLNWRGGETSNERTPAFGAAASKVLNAVADALRKA